MRCKQVRKAVGELTEGSAEAEPAGAVAEHLKSCAECAQFRDQLERTWGALEALPSVELAQDFAQRLYRRLAEPAPKRRRLIDWQPAMGWQWMAIAACVLLFGFFLVRELPVAHISTTEAKRNMTDAWDERFLQDLEQSLSQSDSEYLPVYDSWPEDTLEAFTIDDSKAEPSKGRRERRKST